ncbi:MAG: PAS domain-containing sensor histidine kinase [Bacteroidales bacterium]|nr:PAS domain-containing sensor histidine kinase [Bacteroidales bacterium]MBN2756278.1 PAS domain-containing sensor histidine kinase [Bacteroidales bacterium]
MEPENKYEELLKKLEKQKEINSILKNKGIENDKKIDILQSKQKELEILIDEASVSIIIGDNRGKIISANKRFIELSGYSEKEVINKSLNSFISNNSVPKSFSRKDPTEPTSEFSSEQVLIKKNGIKIYVSTIIKLLSDGRYKVILKDIDLRKKAELALIESENKYRLLTENIHDVVWTTDIDLKTLFISSSITKITGFAPFDYYQKPLNELITPISYRLILDTLEREKEKLRLGKLQKKQYSVTLEIKLLHKREESVWIQLSATIMTNKKGEAIGIHGIMFDINAQKKTQQLLDINEKRINLALKSTNSGIWELNADLTKIKIDDNLLEILGYTKKNLGPYISDWIEITYNEDRKYIIDILQDILDKKYLIKTYECRRVNKDGFIIWFSDTVNAIIDENNNIVELIATSKNITQEKITEDKKYKYYANLQLLLDSSIQFLKFSTIENIYEYLGKTISKIIPESLIVISSIKSDSENSNFNKIYGFEADKFEYLEQFEFSEIEKNKFKSEILQLLDKEILIEYKNGVTSYLKDFFPEILISGQLINSNYQNLHLIGLKENNIIYASINIITKNGYVVYNHEFIEAIIYLACVNINKKSIELKLNKEKNKAVESEKKFKEINAQKDKFFSIISHDLKNPFNTIIGFSDLIVQNYNNYDLEKIQSFNQLINNTAKSTYELMENLFFWAKSQRGNLKIENKEINIDNLINENLKFYSSEAIRKVIELKYNSKINSEIFSDDHILNTILRNLISNALKFTHKKGKIEIDVKEIDDFLQIEIKDNGVGIAEDLQKQIFNIETNKSTIGTDNEKGTGLGLVLCKEYVEKLGGKIWIKSAPEKGSTFIFTIPK